MADPVVASDGYTYDRLAIEAHLALTPRAPVVSPATGARLPSRLLVPNVALRTRGEMPFKYCDPRIRCEV